MLNIILYMLVFLTVLATPRLSPWLTFGIQAVLLGAWMLLNKDRLLDVYAAIVAALVFMTALWVAAHVGKTGVFSFTNGQRTPPIWLTLTWVFALLFAFELKSRFATLTFA